MPVRPFPLLGATRLERARAALADALLPWAAAWGIEPALAVVEVQRASEQGSAAMSWQQGWHAGACSAWLGWPKELGAELQRAMFAPDPGHGPVLAQLAPAAAERALQGLQEAVRTAVLADATVAGGVPAAPAPALFAHGGGALLLRVRVGKQALACLLNPEALDALAPPSVAAPPALPALDYLSALRDTPLTLTVLAGSASIGLGNLVTVGAGDVIRLDNSIDDTVTLTGPGGMALFEAYLGQRDGMVAVELSSTSHTFIGAA